MAAERGLVHSNVAEILLANPDVLDRLKLKKKVFEALPPDPLNGLSGLMLSMNWLLG